MNPNRPPILDDVGESFTARASFFGKTYSFKHSGGDEFLRGKRNHHRDADRMLYYDDMDSLIFRYKGGQWGRSSIALSLIDETTGDRISTLERADPDCRYKWELQTEDSDRVAIVERGPASSFWDPRAWDIPVLSPMTISIQSPDGVEIGIIDGRSFASRITFDIEVRGLPAKPTIALVLAVPLLYEAMSMRSFGGG